MMDSREMCTSEGPLNIYRKVVRPVSLCILFEVYYTFTRVLSIYKKRCNAGIKLSIALVLTGTGA